MKFTVLLAAMFFLSACATTSETIILPNGEQGVAVRCEEFLKNCYREAGESCPDGYEIIERTTSANFLVPVYDLMVVCK
jgi:hypothetical protein